jgi:hypothetical protein
MKVQIINVCVMSCAVLARISEIRAIDEECKSREFVLL